MAEITFHSMADSAYLWSVMHVADEKGVSYAVAPLVYNSPEHWALHPFGKMPVMQHGDLILYESLAIAHYIDRAFHGPPQQPMDSAGQAHVLRWISIVNAYVFPTMNRFMKERIVRPAWGVPADDAFLASARDQLERQVRVIGEAVASGGFLVGEHLTIADSMLLPHLLFFSLTPEGADLLDRRPAVRDWLDRMQRRPSYAVSPMKPAFELMRGSKRPEIRLWSEPVGL